MPSNCISINGKEEYIVPDSKMEGLIRWLKRNGHKYDSPTPQNRVLSYNH